MFPFRLRGRTAASRARLSLETLDGRVLLDATVLVPPAPPLAGDIALAPTDAPPQITSFNAVEVSTGWYLFSGTVSAEHPEGIVVSFGGDPVSLDGKTAIVEADGTFSLLVEVRTDGADDGTATAVCSDENGQSNTAQEYITPSQ